ncbi:MAG TPA: hypothetical protein VKQ07_01315 [Jatrophihabitantaceae bacterium]|nr:hypothetical protein [Jatrophihabitantaceae bacterium]
MPTALPALTDVTATRAILHELAEHVMAAEQYAAAGTVRLHAAPDGFMTGWFTSEDGEVVRLRFDRGELVREYRDVVERNSRAVIAGIDAQACAVLCAWWSLGDAALSALAPRDGESISPVVLWPEHFDIAVTLTTATGAKANLGFSPGDEFSAQPYVYVGPWDARTGEFWNAPFGAYRTYEQLSGEDARAAAEEFLAAARAHLP